MPPKNLKSTNELLPVTLVQLQHLTIILESSGGSLAPRLREQTTIRMHMPTHKPPAMCAALNKKELFVVLRQTGMSNGRRQYEDEGRW